jgi:hypothetical protein
MSTQIVKFDGSNAPVVAKDSKFNAPVVAMGIPWIRLSAKGSKFTLITPAGKTKPSKVGADMDIIILGREETIARTYFQGQFDEENPEAPLCTSRDGIKPDSSIPEENRQSSDCASCPMNIAGSGTDNKSKACRYGLPIIGIPLDGKGQAVTKAPFYFKVNANSIFGESLTEQNRFSFKDLQPALQQINPSAPLSVFKIRMSFDEVNDGMVKILFSPLSYISQEDMDAIEASDIDPQKMLNDFANGQSASPSPADDEATDAPDSSSEQEAAPADPKPEGDDTEAAAEAEAETKKKEKAAKAAATRKANAAKKAAAEKKKAEAAAAEEQQEELDLDSGEEQDAADLESAASGDDGEEDDGFGDLEWD